MRSCDIIIPVYNQRELTRECVESIFRTTRVPVNLIIIDNASDAETKKVLADFKSNELINVKVITNQENLGFGKAVNQGLRLGSSPYLLILNNDTIFTKDCLKIMIDTAASSPDIGIVNPESNTFGIRPASNETEEDLARRLAPLTGRHVEFCNCIGFAMLVKKEVIDKIGVLDESFDIAYFEDTDLSMRAKAAGYRCVKASGAYVFHHEHKSLDKVEWKEELFRKNRELYEKRWGKPLRIFSPVPKDIVNDKERLRKILHDAVTLVRNECYVYFVFGSDKKIEKGRLFEDLGMVETAGIEIKNTPPPFLNIYSLFRILKRRKKKYNLVLTFDRGCAEFLSRFSFLFKGPVFYKTETEDLSGILKLKKG